MKPLQNVKTFKKHIVYHLIQKNRKTEFEF